MGVLACIDQRFPLLAERTRWPGRALLLVKWWAVRPSGGVGIEREDEAMKSLRGKIGTAPRVVVTILGVIVAGIVALGLLALIDGEVGAFLGALALAVIVAVPMAIVYLVARAVQKPTSPTPALAPPQPQAGFQPYPAQEERLLNPEDLR